MGKWDFLVLLVVVISLGHSTEARSRRSGGHGGSKGKNSSSSRHGWHSLRFCFPDNVTKANCFADFPNAGHNTKDWLNWFMPQVSEDSYVINSTWSLDTDDFVVTKIEQNPKYLCEYKDEFVSAMTCLGNFVKKKCPWMPDRMTSMYDKYSKGMDYICSRIHEMDPLCLNLHWGSMGKCKGLAYSKISEDFDHLPRKDKRHRHRGDRGRNHHHTNNTTTTTNSTSSGGQHGNSTGGGGGKWGGRDHGSRNVSDNSTSGGEKSMRSQLYCRFKYVMLQCVRDRVESCHGQTAQIMFGFMRNMSDTSCRAKMDDWDKAQVMKQVVDCEAGDYCGGAAPHVGPRPLGLILLLALLGLGVTCMF